MIGHELWDDGIATGQRMPTHTPIIFDVETTGMAPDKDQIIELAVQRGLEPGAELQVWRFRPSVPIAPAAQAVHGISMEDLADCPSFADQLPEFLPLFEEASILIGYNVKFDLTFLLAELQRNKYPALDLSTKQIVDPLRIWQAMEPRRLENAVLRFTGKELTNAHAAGADVQATGEALQGMLEAFGLAGRPWKELAEITGFRQSDWIGPTYHIRWKEGAPCFAFGKHNGESLVTVAAKDSRSY
ncbi:MAG: 3'-5' exonuclease, partial [Candidatus Omnitrophica bacterium]|nr:3'-5' exonuclease [Candidatus Omnitrophota bacterium]